MAYLAKLAKRISNARTAACATLLALVACAQGESKDFLTPDPHQISPVPVALRIDPELSIVPANQPTQFTATGIASSGQNLPVTVIWSVVGGTITSAGLFTGDHSGQFVIRAYLSTNPSLQDSARAAVWEQPSDVVEVIVSPDSTLIEPGEALKLEALAKLVDGSLSQTEGMLWQANGGQVDGSGRFTANAVGDYVVSAQANNGVKGDSRILVRSRARTVTGFSVNPSAVTVASGQSQQFSATTSWSDGTSEPASFAIWSSTGGTISNGGLFTAGSTPGVFRVIGQEGNGSHADTALVTVQAPLVTALSLTPASVNLAPGATQRFQATATLSDGTVRSFAMSWSATGGTINLNGDYTAGNKAGSYRVIAALPGTSLADTATVTIGDPTATLTGIVLNPSSVSLAAGGSQHFSVAALWSDGSSTAPAITWSATGGSVAPTGLYAAGTAAGTYLVIARASNGVADTSLVVITPAVLTGVSVNPASATVLAGSTQQFAAAGTWSNGGTATPTVTWSAGGGTISSAGLYSADGSAGTYRVIATAQGGAPADTGLVTVTVLPPTLTGLLVSPGSASLFPGGSRQFSVSGTMSDGSTVVPPVSWSATGGTISSSGLYTAGQNVGNYRVIARSTSGSRADTSAVAIALAAPVLTSVVVSPATVSMQTAGTKQFSVSGTWSDGSTGTPSVVWIATGGTITNGGLYSAGTVAGTYRVIATQVAGTKADTADVTVSAAPVLTGISVSPATLSLAPGATQAFTATGTYSNGSTGSPSVTWSATGGTISSAGVYTAGSVAGTFRVIAVQQGGSLADTSAVTINSATSTLTSLVLTPASVAMFSGGQQQFSATGQYSNGTSAPLAVNWSATGGAISAAGLYAAGGTAGSFRVVATDPLSGKADTSTVSISLAPPPGQYQVLVERDWNSYPDKAGVGSQFYVEGGLHTQYPALPVSAFWDLVPDPIFGKVIRYNQDPALNLLKSDGTPTGPGRIATHGVGLSRLGQPNASWWTAPPGTPFADGKTYTPTHVWVRQFFRADPLWTTLGPGGNGDYKTMFLRYWNSAARHELHVGIQERGLLHTAGNPGLTLTASGTGPLHNVQNIDQQYNIQGWPVVDLWPLVQGGGPYPKSPYKAPYGPGNGEWIEIVLHHKTIGNRLEATAYWRQYTVGGVVNPQPWKISDKYEVADPASGLGWVGLARYEMGVNRNAGYANVAHIYWGPYEVVDGSVYPNPWNLP